jgi:hypothetical protein
MKDVKWVFIGGLVLIIIGFILGYLVFPRTVVKYEVREKDVDSTAIVQEARLGYVPQDELSDALKELKKEKNIRFLKTDYRYEIRDSVVIRDSVRVVMIPFFYADTTFTFAKETDKWKFDTEIGIENKFYPGLRTFETKAKMNTLNITVTYEQPWKIDWLSSGIGFGVGSLFTTGIVYLTR